MRRFDPKTRAGLVLGGGGARGVAAIGILAELEGAGLSPTLIAGTSMGALVGAFRAAGHSVDFIRRTALGTRWMDVMDLAGAGGILRGQRFHDWLSEHLPARFEDLEIPLVCTATDIDSGELIYLDSGDLPLALRATCAFPGAFVPVRVDGRNLVDGGLKSTVPVQALDRGVLDLIVACDFQPPLNRRVVTSDLPIWRDWGRFWETLTFRRRNLAADVLLKAVDILQTEVCRRQLADNPPDLYIAPPMPDVNIEDFRRLAEIIEAGAAETRRVLSDGEPA